MRADLDSRGSSRPEQEPVVTPRGHVTRVVKNRPLLLGGLLLFVLLSVAYTFSVDIRASRGAAITGDEPFYLLTTQSIIEDGNLDLKEEYWSRSYDEFFDHPDGLWRQSVPTEDGRLLSPHDPGLSLLLVPGYAVGGLLGVQVELLLLAALAFVLLFVFVTRVSGSILASWVATLFIALSASSFVYATEIYPEVPAALLLIASLLVVSREPGSGVWTGLALAALLTGMAWLGVKYVPLALPVAGYFLLRSQASGRATVLAIGVLSGAYYVWFHLSTFGGLTPYSVNIVYAGGSSPEVLGDHLAFTNRLYRLWGLFIDERFGVGRWAPVLLAAVASLPLVARGGGMQRLVLGLIGMQMLIATFVAITMMGWWFPGRTLMTVLPLFAVPLGVVLRRASGVVRWAIASLAVYTVSITGALAWAGHRGEITIAVDPFEMGSPLFTVFAPLFPNYTAWTPETWLLHSAWLALGVATMTLVALHVSPKHATIVLRRSLAYRRGVLPRLGDRRAPRSKESGIP